MGDVVATLVIWLAGFGVGGFVMWCVMDCRADNRWWEDHPGPEALRARKVGDE